MAKEIILDVSCVGSILAEPIISSMGAKILAEGGELTAKVINKLLQMGIKTARIVSSEEEEAQEAKLVPSALTSLIIKRVEYDFNQVKMGRDLDISKMKELVIMLIDSIKQANEPFFKRVESVGEPFGTHAFNVCVLSILVSNALKKTTAEGKVDLALGALYHDIGKAISEENHCIHGFEILKKTGQLKATSCVLALNHHEYKKELYENSVIIRLSNDIDNLALKNIMAKQAIGTVLQSIYSAQFKDIILELVTQK